MSEKVTILYVEDDETLSFVTKDNLELNGYNVVHFADGKSALDHFTKYNFDLCILDVMLPEMDGYKLASNIRKSDIETPILFLTAKSLKEDRIHGLKLGADDYITKPFSIEELILKIEIFLKRKFVNQPATNNTALGKFIFDHRNLKLHSKDGSVNLTQKEADLLKLLLDNKNNTLTRENVLKKIWGENDYFLGRSMDVFISRIRKYLRPDSSLKIENVHGVGFRLLEEEVIDSSLKK